MTKTTAINVLNQDALPEMTRKRLYIVNVRELYISFARNFRRINSSCSTPKIIVDTFVSIVLKCRMNFSNCETNKKRDFSKSASEKLKRART